MPQKRSIVATGSTALIERVRTHPGQAGWSGVYVAPAARLVLPEQGEVGVRVGDCVHTADELTAFTLAGADRYQLRYAPAGVRSSIVVTGPAIARRAGRASAWLLTPATLLRLRLRLAGAASGGVTPGRAARQALDLLSCATALPPIAEPRQVECTRRLLSAHPGTRLCLDELAEAAHSSPHHLTRQFSRHLGVSLHQYRQRLRVARALSRLAAGERDLAGLAHDLGFASQSHFGAVFLAETGTTPGGARALFRKTAGT